MAKDFIRTWDGRQLEDWGSVVSKEFKQFQGAMKREVKRLAEEHGATLVDWHNGHYDMTGVLEKNGLYVYFSYSNIDRTKVVLTKKNSGWLGCTLMRTMKHAKDWTGGTNNNVEFEQFPETMARLFKEQERQTSNDNQTNNSSTIKKETTMASKTIDHMDFYVAITPYQTEENGDKTFDSLRVSVGYRKGCGFYVGYHPGWGDGSMWGCLFDFSNNPLTAGGSIVVEPATKNSSKRIAEMLENLKARANGIAVYFNERNFAGLDTFMREVALHGDGPNLTNSQTEELNNSKTQNNMEANNMKAADLIGKTIIVGENIATIIIKSADGDTLQTEFKKADSPIGMPLPVTMENLRQQIESGAWKIDNANEDENDNPEPEPETKEPETSNQTDPVLKLWNEAKGRHPGKVIMFRNGNTYVAIAEDAEKVAAAANLKTALSNGTALCVFPHSDMDAVFLSVLKAGHNIAIEDFEVGDNTNVNENANTEPAEPKVQHRVKPKAAQEIDDGNENENMEPETLEPETKDAKPQPKSKPSDVTVEPEDGKPFIREVGKSIIVAGDTSKIEAVLLTLWGRKRPYTHKGKTYSGIQLSAKHKATVVEVIKLAS